MNLKITLGRIKEKLNEKFQECLPYLLKFIKRAQKIATSYTPTFYVKALTFLSMVDGNVINDKKSPRIGILSKIPQNRLS